MKKKFSWHYKNGVNGQNKIVERNDIATTVAETECISSTLMYKIVPKKAKALFANDEILIKNLS